jgi:hypoxanthine phosphoribosyltransferase
MSLQQPALLFTQEQIACRVGELARQISSDYADVSELVMVGVLRGCYMFLADLSRALTVPRRVDFIAVSAYGQQTSPSDALRLIMDVRSDLAGQHVLLVDDIVDSGRTFHYLLNLFRARNPASLRTCAFLRKPGRLEVEVSLDYLGFDIPDVWVVGYGLDCADRFRALPYIGQVDPKELGVE